MGLLLSVLVFSVGVVEALSCYDRFRTGYLPLSYQKGRQHSQTITDIICRLESSLSLSGQHGRAGDKSDDGSDTLRASEYPGGLLDEDEDEDSVASEDTVVPSNHTSSNQELSLDDDVSLESSSGDVNRSKQIESSSGSYDLAGSPEDTISFAENIHIRKRHSKLSRSVSEPLFENSVVTGRLELCTNSVSLEEGLDRGSRRESRNNSKKRVRFNLDAVQICFDKELPSDRQSSDAEQVVVKSRFPMKLRQKKEHLAESMVNTANLECGSHASSPYSEETTKCLRQLAVSEELLSSLEKEARKLLEEELSAKRITNVGISEVEDDFHQPDVSSSVATQDITDVSNELDDDSCGNEQWESPAFHPDDESDETSQTNVSGSPSSTERPLEFKLEDVSDSVDEQVDDNDDTQLKTNTNNDTLVDDNVKPFVHDVQFQNKNIVSNSDVSEDRSNVSVTTEEIVTSICDSQADASVDPNIDSLSEEVEINKQNKRQDAENKLIVDDSTEEARHNEDALLNGDKSNRDIGDVIKSSDNGQAVATDRETPQLKSDQNNLIVDSEDKSPSVDIDDKIKDDSELSNIPSSANEQLTDSPARYDTPSLTSNKNSESIDENVERTSNNEGSGKVLVGGESNANSGSDLIEISTKSVVETESDKKLASTSGEDKEKIRLAKGDAHKEKQVSKSVRTSRVKDRDSESEEEAETKKTPLRRGAVKSKLVFDRSKGPTSQGGKSAGRPRRRAMREGSGTESEEEWRVEEASDGVDGSAADAAASATRAPPQDESRSPAKAFWLIFSGEYTKAMSKDWHSSHFCCWQCDESLTGQRYVLRDDHPYCIKCYESVFANSCEECSRVIGIDSKDLSYKDKHWHEACFLCSKCRVSLVDKQFGSKADKIYCGNCYDAQFASRCDGCSQIFRAGTKKMEYKTRQWHEQCFCCCVCKSPIGTKSFIPREQEIYCATCYEEKFATRCVKCNKIITSGGVTYKNEPWHRECFTCTNCGTSLAGQRFTSREDKPYCADCFGELFAKRCTACCKPITGIGGTRFISFEDRHWHNDCFICAACKASLVGRGFITDGEDIICPECAKQKLM